uniref:Uncharacterized protein n=1 Tax=Arundo donax TaxID=35708 RepID=A0A0A8YXV3_ARUDO
MLALGRVLICPVPFGNCYFCSTNKYFLVLVDEMIGSR